MAAPSRALAAPFDPPFQAHSRRLFDDAWAGLSADGGGDPGNRRRLQTIADLCPRVDSLLDVGCGNGDVLRALREKARHRYGCDTSLIGLAAIAAQDGTAVQAAADRLPFANRAFELVSCCDVLEHLPEAVALLAICELMRVSSRYVLVNVPLEEHPAWSQLCCAACGHHYHRDHHQRSYRAQQLQELLPAATFRLLDSRTTGWTVRHPLEVPKALGAALQLGHDPIARCERCGARPRPLGRLERLLRDAFVFGHSALTRPWKGLLSRDTEIVVLFARREKP